MIYCYSFFQLLSKQAAPQQADDVRLHSVKRHLPSTAAMVAAMAALHATSLSGGHQYRISMHSSNAQLPWRVSKMF
jgi:hypothetical protein